MKYIFLCLSNAAPNQIQMSESTALLLMSAANAKYRLTKRGIVKVKGKGDVNTYWLNEHSEAEEMRAAGRAEAAGQKQPLRTTTSNNMLGLLNDANGGGAEAAGGSRSALGLRNRKSSQGAPNKNGSG